MTGREIKPYAFAVLFGVLGALALLYWGAPSAQHILDRQKRDNSNNFVPLTSDLSESGRLALRYASAVQQGQCEKVVALTWWMQERIHHVKVSSSEAAELDRAVEAMCENLRARTPEGNQLSDEGIEDQYVFSTGSNIEIVGVDAGQEGLAKPVGQRAWIMVTYPSEVRAPRDLWGNPIRSLRVGINVSTDGYVLKSGVRGNLDFDLESVSYNWSDEGG